MASFSVLVDEIVYETGKEVYKFGVVLGLCDHGYFTRIQMNTHRRFKINGTLYPTRKGVSLTYPEAEWVLKSEPFSETAAKAKKLWYNEFKELAVTPLVVNGENGPEKFVKIRKEKSKLLGIYLSLTAFECFKARLDYIKWIGAVKSLVYEGKNADEKDIGRKIAMNICQVLQSTTNKLPAALQSPHEVLCGLVGLSYEDIKSGFSVVEITECDQVLDQETVRSLSEFIENFMSFVNSL